MTEYKIQLWKIQYDYEVDATTFSDLVPQRYWWQEMNSV